MKGWQVRLTAVLVALTGLINGVSALTPALHDRLELLAPYLPGFAQHSARLTATLAGFGLLLLATNLWRRKHMAWALTEVLLGVSLVSHLLKGLDFEEALVGGALLIWLWLLRAEYQAQSDPPSVQQGLRVLAGALLFTLAYGVAGFFLLDRHFSINFGLGAAVRQTLVMFTEFYDPGLQPVTHFGRYFVDSIYGVGAATLGYATLMLFRPVLVRQPASAAERERAAEIVAQWGHTSLARFTLLPDKSYFLSPGGSVVAFVTKGRTAVALGDPIGPPDDVAPALHEFQGFCRRNDWAPAFYQVLPEQEITYRQAGFTLLHIGDEAVVDLPGFSLEGGGFRSVRRAVNTLTKGGYRAEFHAAPLPDPLLRELRHVSDEWLSLMHGREKRFSLGWFEEDYLRGTPVLVVRAPDGRAIAFANLLPEYQKNECTADMMRRLCEVPPGTMDFLFVSLLQWAREQGYDSFNLGLSALSGVGAAPDDPRAERALHFLYEHVDQFYNFKGLHAFKDKFDPRWEPRYLAYPSASSLPGLALALIRADSGDEFIGDYLGEWLRSRLKLWPPRTTLSPRGAAGGPA
jgi:phosphatidylglycerol lysyltransferase